MKKALKNILLLIIFFIGMLTTPAFASINSANMPLIVQGLTPVKYSNGTWKTTNSMDPDWYDYENGEWANAQTNNGDKYVWIPRFTYKIEGEKIYVKWSDGKKDDLSGNYLIHPAFYFGEYFGGELNEDNLNARNNLTGFWIKKELSSENVTDVSSTISSSIRKANEYQLSQSGTYLHMTKASEWGALAYIAKAKGNIIENRTTMNQTGVKLGNVPEYVAGLKGNPSLNVDIINSGYGRYRDLFNENIQSYYGCALNETQYFAKEIGIFSDNSFLVRGGSFGLFGYGSGTGNDTGKGYRTVISIITEELSEPVSFFDTEASVVGGDFLVLGVDFDVRVPWKFPSDPSNFFIDLENLGNKKIIDMECIYEGIGTFRQKDLNAEVIKMIDPDLKMILPSNINSSNIYNPGKYTIVIRIGGKYEDGKPVFKPMDKLDAKIIVNQLNLLDGSGTNIKIDKIPNNKVRLSIYGESESNLITKVVLKTAPTKKNYDLEEDLDVSGGIIVPYLGELPGEEIQLTLNEVVNKNVTNTSGNHQVELNYQGIPVVQEGTKYIINVSNTRQLKVYGKTSVNGIEKPSQFQGPGKYSRKDTDYTIDLVAPEYFGPYKFVNWESTSNEVKAKNNKNFATTFTVPNKSKNISDNEVTITANYIEPTSLEVRDPKKEFYIGDSFSLGKGKIIVVYLNNGSKEEREITLDTPDLEITLKDKDNNVKPIDKLEEGYYTVTIEYGNQFVEYTIEVVNRKNVLTVSVASTEYGEVIGSIKDFNGLEKDRIEILGENKRIYKNVSQGRNVTLKAEAKNGYGFAGWEIVGLEEIITEESKLLPEISFTMPAKDVAIEARFKKTYNITFKVKQGQESKGSLDGETTQKVAFEGSTSPVKAIPNSGNGFYKWVDKYNKLVSYEPELIVNYVTEEQEYTALFDNEWTVTFYNEDKIFKTKQVLNGESGNITEIPEKYGYVFMGWSEDSINETKELSSVTRDMTVHALYVPRIQIDENTSPAENTIDALITGTKIEEGTLQYLISSSKDTPLGHKFNYKMDDKFTGLEGSWYNLEELYRSSNSLSSSQDSSTLLTITSKEAKEVVNFEYMLSSTTDSQLGITINGERVVGPDMVINPGWNSFSKEVDVINGQIKVGISYSQGEDGKDDFAAIRNLMVENKWTDIPNSYHLVIPVQFSQNYIHVRGVGSDDLTTVYRAVSDVFTAKGEILDTYTIAFNGMGGYGEMSLQTFTEGKSQNLIPNQFKKDGYEFMGWAEVADDIVKYADKSSYIATKDAVLYAVWKDENTGKYVITAIQHEGGKIEGVYKNHKCSVCGGKDHECNIMNVMIDADNAKVRQ